MLANKNEQEAPTVVLTKSGTRYEFEWSPDSSASQARFGRVRKDAEGWTGCFMLTGDFVVGQKMVMTVGADRGGPVRQTSAVAEIGTR